MSLDALFIALETVGEAYCDTHQEYKNCRVLVNDFMIFINENKGKSWSSADYAAKKAPFASLSAVLEAQKKVAYSPPFTQSQLTARKNALLKFAAEKSQIDAQIVTPEVLEQLISAYENFTKYDGDYTITKLDIHLCAQLKAAIAKWKNKYSRTVLVDEKTFSSLREDAKAKVQVEDLRASVAAKDKLLEEQKDGHAAAIAAAVIAAKTAWDSRSFAGSLTSRVHGDHYEPYLQTLLNPVRVAYLSAAVAAYDGLPGDEKNADKAACKALQRAILLDAAVLEQRNKNNSINEIYSGWKKSASVAAVAKVESFFSNPQLNDHQLATCVVYIRSGLVKDSKGRSQCIIPDRKLSDDLKSLNPELSKLFTQIAREAKTASQARAAARGSAFGTLPSVTRRPSMPTTPQEAAIAKATTSAFRGPTSAFEPEGRLSQTLAASTMTAGSTIVGATGERIGFGSIADAGIITPAEIPVGGVAAAAASGRAPIPTLAPHPQ